MSKKIFLSGLLLALSLSLSACLSPSEKAAQKASETLAEKAIENAGGGSADVDINEDNVSVKTDSGEMQAGENVKLPDDFPADIYVIDGKITAAIKTAEKNGYTVSIDTKKPLAEIKSTYENKLETMGWKITQSMDFGDSSSLMGEKENRAISILIGKNDLTNNVVITVMEK